MIYDIHTHNFTGRTEQVVSEAQRHNINRILLLGDVLRHGETPSQEQVQEINNDTIDDIKKLNNFADGFCFLNPALDPNFIKSEIKRCSEIPNMRGVKLEISLCCSDQKMDTLIKELEQYKWPLLQHTWFKTTEKYPNESDPTDVAVLAKRYPNVKIIMAHLTGCGYRGVECIAECPNVYVDTSGGQPEDGFLQYAIKRIGSKRIIYGSDAPCRDFGCQIEKILDANLSSEELNNILYKNAMELLQI